MAKKQQVARRRNQEMKTYLSIVQHHGEFFVQTLSRDQNTLLKEDSVRKILMEEDALAATILADLQGHETPMTCVDELTGEQLCDVIQLLNKYTNKYEFRRKASSHRMMTTTCSKRMMLNRPD